MGQDPDPMDSTNVGDVMVVIVVLDGEEPIMEDCTIYVGALLQGIIHCVLTPSHHEEPIGILFPNLCQVSIIFPFLELVP